MESALFDILFSMFIGYVLARAIVWLLVKRIESKFEAELETLVTKVVDEMLIPVTVEVDNNQYFCYNAMTNAFVCQGFNVEEIADNFKARYPNKKMALYNGDETALKTLKTQMEKLKNENSSSVGSAS